LAPGCRCLLIGVFAVSAATKLRNAAALRGVAARAGTIPLPRGAAHRPPLVIKRAVTMAAGSVFLLGDNRAASDDSRVWGALPVQEVVGAVVRRLSRCD
jgi:type IV secretory pathway protease TraF